MDSQIRYYFVSWACSKSCLKKVAHDTLGNVPMEELFQDWLGVGSVMRHFLCRSWPELHRRIICPAGFLSQTVYHTRQYHAIPYYTRCNLTIPYKALPCNSRHYDSKASCLRSDRRRNVISSCSHSSNQRSLIRL